MKLIFLIISLSSLWIIETKRIRINKVGCGSSNRTAVNCYCYLKAYDRKNPLINGGFTLTRTSPNAMTFVGFYRKSGYDFDLILKYTDLPLCKLVRESKIMSTFAPFIQLIVKSFKETFGVYAEACEKIGEYKLRNVSGQEMPLLAQWPKGQYKVEIRFFDDIDDNITNSTIFMTILN